MANAAQQTYLEAAYAAIRADILPEAPILDSVIVTYGFPSRGAGSRKRKTIGECWPAQIAPAGYAAAIFIHPCQWTAPIDVLHVLLHEMIHAATPECVKSPHRGAFVKLMKRVGLVGKPTATEPGPELTERLNALGATLPPFPAAHLDARSKEKKGSRLRLYQCVCPVKVRVASDDFDATCNVCETPFERQGA